MAASTLTSWALLIWQELESRQIDADQLFRQANLEPAKLRNVVGRYPLQDLQVLWNLIHQRLGDEFGISAGLRWNPTTFHALGFAWLASESLGEAFFRVARYGRFLNDGLHYELLSEGPWYRFRISIDPEKSTMQLTQLSPLGIDAMLASILKMSRMLLGESFNPISINCPHPPNSAGLLMEKMARCPISYGGDSADVILDRHDVDKSLLTGNRELSHSNEQILAGHLASIDKNDLVSQVEKIIAQQLPSGEIKEAKVASLLNLSERTLQRRLTENGASFKQLLEKTRKSLARRYVEDQKLSMGEVAYLLGFSEQANFARAFKRWYGETPTKHRTKSCA